MAKIDDLKAALEEAYADGRDADVETLSQAIEAEQANPSVPDVPIQPVPQNQGAQYPGEGVPPENLPADKFTYAQRYGTPPAQVQVPGNILPISKTMNVDPTTGKMTNIGQYSAAVPDIINSAASAATLPGRVFQGQVDPMSNAGIDEAANLAQWVTGGIGMRGGGVIRPTVTDLPKAGTTLLQRGTGPVQPRPMTTPSLIPESLRPAVPEMTPQELRNKNSQWNRVNEIGQMKAQPETRSVTDKGNIRIAPAKSKLEVMRNEMGNLLATRPAMFDQKTQELMRNFSRGDSTVDTLINGLANRKSNLGLKAAWEILKWGGLTGSAAQSSLALKYTGLLAAASTAAGVAEKAGSLAAKGARILKTNRDINKIKSTIAGKQKLPLSTPAEPITPKYRPDAPVKINEPKPMPEPDSPTAAMQRYMAEEDAKPINPSGEIKMTTGAPIPKKQGSLAPKPPKVPKKQQVLGQAEPSVIKPTEGKLSASEIRQRVREREFDQERAARQGVTSPTPKKTDIEAAKAIQDYINQQNRKKGILGGGGEPPKGPKPPRKGRGSY